MTSAVAGATDEGMPGKFGVMMIIMMMGMMMIIIMIIMMRMMRNEDDHYDEDDEDDHHDDHHGEVMPGRFSVMMIIDLTTENSLPTLSL